MRIVAYFVTGLMLNGTDLVTGEAVQLAMHLHKKAMHLHRSGRRSMHDFDTKALASEHCQFESEFTWTYEGGNSHKAVEVM